jgi:regulator of protease activity HflC (stomatin/prohibitin superfamily)
MRHVPKTGIMLIAVAFAATAIAAGCASTPRLSTEKSTSGIRAAEEASLHLQMAKEELDLARDLAAKGEKEQAKSMLLRAEADAELAVTLSHRNADRVEAEKAMARVYQLRQDNP